MNVYLVISEHWEDWKIEGVYASSKSALAAHPVKAPLTWNIERDGTGHVVGLKYGQAWLIERHRVQK